jgi:succinoglycan biosynthesis transport protein ExoP
MAPFPPSNPPPSEYEFDLSYHLQLLWRSRVLMGAALAGGLLFGWLAAEVQIPQFRARALLQVSPPNPTSMGVADAITHTGNLIRDRQFFNTQLSVLNSRDLARRAAERLKLPEQPGFSKDLEAAAGVLQRHMSVEPIPESFVVEVRITRTDPKEAALWANTIADVYIERSFDSHVEAAKRAYNWVNERLAEARQTMQATQDKALKSYQGQEVLVAEGGVQAVASSISTLNEQLVQAQAQRINIEAELDEMTTMRQRGQSLDTHPLVSQDATCQELSAKARQLQLERSRLKAKFKDIHPEVQRIQAQIDEVRKARQARIAQIEGGLGTTHRQLQRREAELREAIEVQKGQAAAQSVKLSELDSLKRQAESANNLYGVLLQKLNETNIAASIPNDNVRLIDRAMEPRVPAFPDKRRFASIGALIGLCLAAAFVFLRDHLGNTIKDVDDLERYLHIELLAAVPRFDKKNQPLVNEAYQTLRTALLFARKGEHGHVVLVTGTAPGEGKTTTLLNLAKLLASAGEPTVVVDGDLRRPTVHQRLNVAREPGLGNLMRQLDLTTVLQTTREKNLSVLPSGPPSSNSPALLARAEVASLFDRLRHHFRWVLVDSSPLASVSDALLLAQHADMTLLVVQHNKVDKKVVKRNLAMLRRVTANVLGVVFNAVDLKSTGHYHYYYTSEPEKPAEDAPARPRVAPRPGRSFTAAG